MGCVEGFGYPKVRTLPSIRMRAFSTNPRAPVPSSQTYSSSSGPTSSLQGEGGDSCKWVKGWKAVEGGRAQTVVTRAGTKGRKIRWLEKAVKIRAVVTTASKAGDSRRSCGAVWRRYPSVLHGGVQGPRGRCCAAAVAWRHACGGMGKRCAGPAVALLLLQAGTGVVERSTVRCCWRVCCHVELRSVAPGAWTTGPRCDA